MSENIQSISQGTYTIGQTSATNFIAGQGIKIDEPSAGTVRIGTDETVLWEYTGTARGATGTYNLSESWKNFEKIRITEGCVYGGPRPGAEDHVFDTKLANDYKNMTIFNTDMVTDNFNSTGKEKYFSWYAYNFSADNSITLTPSMVWFVNYNSSPKALTGRMSQEKSRGTYKIVGINRISGSNT